MQRVISKQTTSDLSNSSLPLLPAVLTIKMYHYTRLLISTSYVHQRNSQHRIVQLLHDMRWFVWAAKKDRDWSGLFQAIYIHTHYDLMRAFASLVNCTKPFDQCNNSTLHPASSCLPSARLSECMCVYTKSDSK